MCTRCRSRNDAAPDRTPKKKGAVSYPYPQDRHRDRKEKGEQTYKDAVEDYSENQAEIDRKASIPHEQREPDSIEDVERDAEERLERIGENVDDSDGT